MLRATAPVPRGMAVGMLKEVGTHVPSVAAAYTADGEGRLEEACDRNSGGQRA